MSEIIEKSEDLVAFVKKTILRYCPVVADRNQNNLPEMSIDITNKCGGTQILFLYGNHSAKSSVRDRAITNYVVSVEEIANIIDFLLDDFHVFSGISVTSDAIKFYFMINWSNESIRGIFCNNVEMCISFDNSTQKQNYLLQLIDRYYAVLENEDSFKRLENAYFSKKIEEHVDSLDRDGMLELFNKMTDDEMRTILMHMESDTFKRIRPMEKGRKKELKHKNLRDKKEIDEP